MGSLARERCCLMLRVHLSPPADPQAEEGSMNRRCSVLRLPPMATALMVNSSSTNGCDSVCASSGQFQGKAGEAVH